MTLDRLTYPFARLHLRFSKRRERHIGYRLRLTRLSPNWIDSTLVFDMAHVWRRFGLDAVGVNYFTIGSVKNGQSCRYDAASPYYQSWLGGYIVRFPTPRDWTLADHFQLGVADQTYWLRYFGVRNPMVKVQKGSVKNRGVITIASGQQGKLYEGNIWSNTDVGDRNPRMLRLMMSGMANLFLLENPRAKVTGPSLVPKQSDQKMLAPFQNILLKGFTAIIPLNADTTVMLYANGCEFTDRNGKKHDPFTIIRQKLIRDLEHVEIRTA